MDKAEFIGLKAMPLDEKIKGGQGESEAGLQRRPSAMGHFLEMTHAMKHREHSFHQHPSIPQASITQFEIPWISLFGMEGRVAEHDHLLFIRGNQRMESGIGGIRARTIPADH